MKRAPDNGRRQYYYFSKIRIISPFLSYTGNALKLLLHFIEHALKFNHFFVFL